MRPFLIIYLNNIDIDFNDPSLIEAYNTWQNLYSFKDSFFYYNRQQVFLSAFKNKIAFFQTLAGFIAIGNNYLVLEGTRQNPKGQYTEYYPSFNSTEIFFQPFNWFGTEVIYYENAGDIKANNNFFKVFSIGHEPISFVRETGVYDTYCSPVPIGGLDSSLVPLPKKSVSNGLPFSPSLVYNITYNTGYDYFLAYILNSVIFTFHENDSLLTFDAQTIAQITGSGLYELALPKVSSGIHGGISVSNTFLSTSFSTATGSQGSFSYTPPTYSFIRLNETGAYYFSAYWLNNSNLASYGYYNSPFYPFPLTGSVYNKTGPILTFFANQNCDLFLGNQYQNNLNYLGYRTPTGGNLSVDLVTQQLIWYPITNGGLYTAYGDVSDVNNYVISLDPTNTRSIVCTAKCFYFESCVALSFPCLTPSTWYAVAYIYKKEMDNSSTFLVSYTIPSSFFGLNYNTSLDLSCGLFFVQFVIYSTTDSPINTTPFPYSDGYLGVSNINFCANNEYNLQGSTNNEIQYSFENATSGTQYYYTCSLNLMSLSLSLTYRAFNSTNSSNWTHSIYYNSYYLSVDYVATNNLPTSGITHFPLLSGTQNQCQAVSIYVTKFDPISTSNFTQITSPVSNGVIQLTSNASADVFEDTTVVNPPTYSRAASPYMGFSYSKEVRCRDFQSFLLVNNFDHATIKSINSPKMISYGAISDNLIGTSNQSQVIYESTDKINPGYLTAGAWYNGDLVTIYVYLKEYDTPVVITNPINLGEVSDVQMTNYVFAPTVLVQQLFTSYNTFSFPRSNYTYYTSFYFDYIQQIFYPALTYQYYLLGLACVAELPNFKTDADAPFDICTRGGTIVLRKNSSPTYNYRILYYVLTKNGKGNSCNVLLTATSTGTYYATLPVVVGQLYALLIQVFNLTTAVNPNDLFYDNVLMESYIPIRIYDIYYFGNNNISNQLHGNQTVIKNFINKAQLILSPPRCISTKHQSLPSGYMGYNIYPNYGTDPSSLTANQFPNNFGFTQSQQFDFVPQQGALATLSVRTSYVNPNVFKNWFPKLGDVDYNDGFEFRAYQFSTQGPAVSANLVPYTLNPTNDLKLVKTTGGGGVSSFYYVLPASSTSFNLIFTIAPYYNNYIQITLTDGFGLNQIIAANTTVTVTSIHPVTVTLSASTAYTGAFYFATGTTFSVTTTNASAITSTNYPTVTIDNNTAVDVLFTAKKVVAGCNCTYTVNVTDISSLSVSNNSRECVMLNRALSTKIPDESFTLVPTTTGTPIRFSNRNATSFQHIDFNFFQQEGISGETYSVSSVATYDSVYNNYYSQFLANQPFSKTIVQPDLTSVLTNGVRSTKNYFNLDNYLWKERPIIRNLILNSNTLTWTNSNNALFTDSWTYYSNYITLDQTFLAFNWCSAYVVNSPPGVSISSYDITSLYNYYLQPMFIANENFNFTCIKRFRYNSSFKLVAVAPTAAYSNLSSLQIVLFFY